MRRAGRWFAATTVAVLATALGTAACGGSRAHADRPRAAITLLMATTPDSLDPAVGYTTQALEPDWLVYTPLITYGHSRGVPGTRLIPGLATDLPAITNGGRTYSFVLRKRLVYSDGDPVKASDFTRAVERAIRLSWGGASQFIIAHIEGARAFADRRSSTITGITTNDATGEITIRLTAPYGPFENVLAFPSMAPVPGRTPFEDEQSNPPPGAGPYEIAKVVVGQSFSVIKNPAWPQMRIPGIPAGHVDVNVRITGDAAGNAMSVLGNTADVFDWADRVPESLLAQIERQAAHRYSRQVMNGTFLIFLNVTRTPFSSQLARQAVQVGLDEAAMKRFGSATLQVGCYFLPPSMYGHPHDQCPGGSPALGGNIAAARALVRQSHTAGTRVTVWSEADSPMRQWMSYYTSLLNRIGYIARQKVIPDQSYYGTIGRLYRHPQTGLGDFYQDFPNPVDFYQWLTGKSISQKNNQNWGEINDPYVDRQVRRLAAVPASNLYAVASFWHRLERYVASRAYVAVFGYPTFPEFVSDRIDARDIMFSPVAGPDWSSFELK